jgi:hypothetical protein
MITETQIIEAAKECGLYGFRSPTPEVIEAATKFAQHWYRIGLLDAAEKCKNIRWKGYVPPEDGGAAEYFDGAAECCEEEIRQMAKE